MVQRLVALVYPVEGQSEEDHTRAGFLVLGLLIVGAAAVLTMAATAAGLLARAPARPGGSATSRCSPG